MFFSLNSPCTRNQHLCLVNLEKVKLRIKCSKYFSFLGNGLELDGLWKRCFAGMDWEEASRFD